MKYRLKTQEVEAERFNPGQPLPAGVRPGHSDPPAAGMLDTNIGPVTVNLGDWIVTHQNGVQWAESDVAFRRRYEPVEPLNLYYVQDTERPMYVAARDWTHALERWRERMLVENPECADEELEPSGIELKATGNAGFPEFMP